MPTSRGHSHASRSVHASQQSDEMTKPCKITANHVATLLQTEASRARCRTTCNNERNQTRVKRGRAGYEYTAPRATMFKRAQLHASAPGLKATAVHWRASHGAHALGIFPQRHCRLACSQCTGHHSELRTGFARLSCDSFRPFCDNVTLQMLALLLLNQEK